MYRKEKVKRKDDCKKNGRKADGEKDKILYTRKKVTKKGMKREGQLNLGCKGLGENWGS